MPLRLLLLCLLLTSYPAHAQSAARPTPAIPEALQAWVGWVLHGHEKDLCPSVHGSDRRQCAWPSRLQLDLDDAGGRFSQEWYVDVPLWVPLPGDARAWPHDVRVDGKDTIVVDPLTQPHVHLDAGHHTVSGRFAWDGLPQTLAVPPATGLLALSVRGAAQPFPERDDERVWLQRRSEPQEQNRIEISVHRRILDDIPLQMTTRIDLKVAGERREEILGRPLLTGLVPMALQSSLPARLEADGHLRVQVRPGTWSIDLVARHQGPVAELQLAEPDGPWDTQEIWVFEARSDLRVVSIEGVAAVDPQQTELPDDWRSWPAYALKVGDRMRFIEKQRGDADPAPDRLILQRTWWLDFDGGGYTLRDQITGTMNRSWRLSMRPPALLGRVAIDGVDQLITESPGGGGGIEVRPAQVRIEAESRLEGGGSTLEAVGWEHDVQELSAELKLGPGWKLLHASGVDRASPTWVDTWTLFDLFVVLLVSMGFSRLWGKAWGALALLTLVLSYIEPGAPGDAWVAVLVAEALVRVLPSDRWAQGAKLLRLGACVLLLFEAAPFMVQQARQALHPALGAPGIGEYGGYNANRDRRYSGSDVASSVSAPEIDQQEASAAGAFAKSYVYEADPTANVQTGPGVPAWQWSTVSLQWSGPVEAAQQLHLRLIPPWLTRLIEAARVLLLAALILCIVQGLRSTTAVGSWVVPGLAVLLSAPAVQAQAPPAELLDQLRQRLLEAPACAPSCVAANEMFLEAEAGSLRLRLRVDAAATVAVPLPGHANQWIAESIVLDGSPAPALRRDDGLAWIRLTPGRHEVILQGLLPARDEVQIHLPLLPHRVRSAVQGWKLEGVHADGVADDDVVLTRIRKSTDVANAVLEPNTLPPFVQVMRTLHLGLTWEVETTVVRATPPGVAALLEIPLLPGEAVTSPDLRTVDGKVLVNLGASDRQREWRSLLPQTEKVTLLAGDAAPWTEVWSVDASPLWHVEAAGIPAVHEPFVAGNRIRKWQPWPGESVELTLTRPPPRAGRTITIDASEVSISPGQRATDVHLHLTLRSGRGGEHSLTLPETAELQTVSLGGVEQPIRQDGRKVTLPLVPGAQEVKLVWRQPGELAVRFDSPLIDIGAPSVNASVIVTMPEQRWTLFLRGPLLGPSVLFWGLLAVFLLASIGLGRVPTTPLTWYHWFLLSLGLTQAPVVVAFIVVGWLLLLGWRRTHGPQELARAFNGLQLLVIVSTLAALAGLLLSIQQGLLGLPEMQIAGNDSSAHQLRWFQDISTEILPRVSVYSVPLFVYRLAMLLWALWLARALLGWLRWGWESFTSGGLWQPRRRKEPAAEKHPPAV